MERGKIKEYVLKFNTPRRVIQVLSFIFFSASIFSLGALPLLLPVLWTWGLSPNIVGDAFTALQLMLEGALFPWLALASFFAVGVLVGKSLCGWVCPFGFIQDLIDFAKKRKRDFSLRTHESMVYVKYVVLGITLFISVTFSITKVMGISENYKAALGDFTKAPFTTLSPAETLFTTLPRTILKFGTDLVNKPTTDALAGIGNFPALFWMQLAVLIAVIVVVAFVPRGWCKYFCPHGAIMAVLNRFSFVGLHRDPVKCAKSSCRLCVAVCPMRVPILDLPWEKFSHSECIYCMKCVDACKDHAIKLKYP